MTRLSTLLEDLRGFVLDERRVVTYRWLAITLSISFDAAKRLLYAFTQEAKEQGKDNLVVTYFVSGQKKCDAGGDRVPMESSSLVPENRLEKTTEMLHEVTSIHVYSAALTKPYAGGATGMSYVNDLWAVDAEHDREITLDTNAGRLLRCGVIKCDEVQFEEPKTSFSRQLPPTHEYPGHKACNNVSHMSGTINCTAAVTSNGKKDVKIKTKSNLKAINPSTFFADGMSNANLKDLRKNPEGQVELEEGTKCNASSRNGEVGSKKRMANTNPIPTSRLNLFKKKKGAIDSFVKPRDDFDFPESNPLGQDDPNTDDEYGSGFANNEPIDKLKPADPEEDQFEGGGAVDPPAIGLHPSDTKIKSEVQEQLPRKNRYTGEDVTECNDLGEKVEDEGESSVQKSFQNQHCDLNRHFLSSSSMSKVKRKKQKMQIRTFMDEDGYLQHVEEMIEVTDESESETDATGGDRVSESGPPPLPLSKKTAILPLVGEEWKQHTLSVKKWASETKVTKDRGKTSAKGSGKKSAKQLGIGRFFGK